MRILYRVLILLSFFILPSLVHAETHVHRDDLSHGGNWTKQGSPYILEEEAYLPSGYSLQVEKGVKVISASSSMLLNGDFTVNGSVEEPVQFQNLEHLYLAGNKSDLRNVQFSDTGLEFTRSTSTLSGVIIRDAEYGIYARRSSLTIEKSTLVNNAVGLGSYEYQDVFPMRQMAGIDPKQNTITITDSVIEDNSRYDIENHTINPVEAIQNWWGSPVGPQKNFGAVNATPWKTKNPQGSTCCSNVLFLPGLEASRLYIENNQLWEPNRNDDIRNMYLDTTGKSIDASIYTADVMDSAFGLKNIYKSFIAMMNGVVADGTIMNWLPSPYDWRMSTEDVVYGRTKLATSTVSLIEEAEKLARTSKTGRIIVMAHSNGGLVAKVLAKALEEKGESNLLEKIVYVAVPALGTPQAILGMLHGHNQSIALGLVATEDTARTLSQNMRSAYALLPSKKFFEKNPLKVVSDLFSSPIEKSAATYDAMKNFLLKNSFSKATTTNTDIPLLLNPSLMSLAESIHSKIDSWKPASSTQTVSIIGWGLPTSAGIEYEKDKHCGFLRKCDLAYSPIATSSGDGTVLAESSSGLAARNLFLNLKKLDQDTRQKINHANILESKEVLTLLKNEISTSTTIHNSYISETRPVDNDKWLTIKIYSPVDLEILDKNGNSDIPASYYEDFGKVKMAVLPYGDYQILLKGTDTGVFTLESEISQQGKVLSSASFEDIPVTPNLNAELLIGTSTALSVDTNGDGITEYVLNDKKMKKIFQKKIRKILRGIFDRKRRFW